jgi:D-arabinose 5-phosphate isomerase GutQ
MIDVCYNAKISDIFHRVAKVIRKIERNTAHLINSTAIVMIGGFGKSGYLN